MRFTIGKYFKEKNFSFKISRSSGTSGTISFKYLVSKEKIYVSCLKTYRERNPVFGNFFHLFCKSLFLKGKKVKIVLDFSF